eukprot:737236-Prorocentrum_minimum.AAC.1
MRLALVLDTVKTSRTSETRCRFPDFGVLFQETQVGFLVCRSIDPSKRRHFDTVAFIPCRCPVAPPPPPPPEAPSVITTTRAVAA